MPTLTTGCTDTIVSFFRPPTSNYDLYSNINCFIDVVKINPNEDEKELCQAISECLSEANEECLQFLSSYVQGNHLATAFLDSNTIEDSRNTFKIVKRTYDFAKKSLEIAAMIQRYCSYVLGNLVNAPLPLSEQINQSQALAIQLGLIMNFVYQFDNLKLQHPGITNDISHYRRMISRPEANGISDEAFDLEESNRVLLFFSEAYPMLKVVIQSTQDYVQNSQVDISNTTETLCQLVYICKQMIEKEEHREKLTPELQRIFIRSMVITFVIYDFIHPSGAFSRQSNIDVKAMINVIKMSEMDSTQLMNALKYTSKTYESPTTPKAIKALFD